MSISCPMVDWLCSLWFGCILADSGRRGKPPNDQSASAEPRDPRGAVPLRGGTGWGESRRAEIGTPRRVGTILDICCSRFAHALLTLCSRFAHALLTGCTPVAHRLHTGEGLGPVGQNGAKYVGGGGEDAEGEACCFCRLRQPAADAPVVVAHFVEEVEQVLAGAVGGCTIWTIWT